MNQEQGLEILEIQKQIVNNFQSSDWIELGFLLGCTDIIQGHPRLLRSLSWGDEDYPGNVLTVLSAIVQKEPKRLQEIKSILMSKYSMPAVSEFISTAHKEVPKKNIAFSPQVFEVPDKQQNEKLVAVMLPFKYIETFSAVKKSCNKLGLECKKADDLWENATIIQDIFELIFTCKVVVADFTEKKS
jgi:hypothetical protein